MLKKDGKVGSDNLFCFLNNFGYYHKWFTNEIIYGLLTVPAPGTQISAYYLNYVVLVRTIIETI